MRGHHRDLLIRSNDPLKQHVSRLHIPLPVIQAQLVVTETHIFNLYSPAFLCAEFFPRIRRLNDAWHEHGFSCLFHSDGYLMDVLDDLLQAGIDGLNPIEIVAGMDVGEVRRAVGPGIFLAGGIDMSQLLANGTPEDVRHVCRRAVREAAPGYFMGSTTEADNSCRVENLIAMAETAWETVT